MGLFSHFIKITLLYHPQYKYKWQNVKDHVKLHINIIIIFFLPERWVLWKFAVNYYITSIWNTYTYMFVSIQWQIYTSIQYMGTYYHKVIYLKSERATYIYIIASCRYYKHCPWILWMKLIKHLYSSRSWSSSIDNCSDLPRVSTNSWLSELKRSEEIWTPNSLVMSSQNVTLFLAVLEHSQQKCSSHTAVYHPQQWI